ncbi:cytochrome c oxidase subunit I [Sphingomonas pseudosanguinis]|uniref:cytochrome-c oxidase n=1 Tax=Sphingomonas pseudosanguinis TaxID=413712 RepID=A0A7W6F497_9SPHN|nr:cytochrome c oxidase subunit I [Sphingomonas pseudosanguinis]MBB3880692.1 cytochrome c oxidase subunit I+III [Sphingomonas pseudosanguinis]MBN3535164.1 cytochrome c oxidase subunit I [Sphingomonas pseudosanguinis]
MSALKRHQDLTAIWGNEPGWRGYLRSVNHSDIGKRFIVAAFVFFAIGGVLAMLIRAQLATPRSAFVGPEVYNQLFTMHGSIMMFLFAIPMFEGLTMYLLPKMLGSRDLAFPRLSSLGWWCYLFGGTIIVLAMLAGVAPDAGWFLYPPLSGKTYTPGINSDVWLLGITFVEISAMCAAIEITVSILKLRAAGMRFDRMPIFAWYLLGTAGMMVFGFPPLILGSILLEVERAFGWPFYSPELGGSPLLWQHLFWLFGHPEVYIIFLPAAGAVSTILPVMARTRLLGYGAIVAAVMALAFLSFGLWVHHMFTTGIPHMALGFFSAASALVAIPTAVQIFAWLGTLWQGRPEMKLPMLYLVGFFIVFVLGGLTGVMLAMVPFDAQAHDTAFVTAHLHYVLVGGFVFPMLAAAYYWLPHITGRERVMRVGEAAFWLIFIGFNLTFFMMHLTGLLGMPRRIDTYPEGMGWTWLNLLSSVGGFLQAFGFALFLIDVVLQIWLGRVHRRNPWGATTLEWAMPIPSTTYNFASLPTVTTRDPLADDPDLGVALARGEGLLAEARHGWRETLAVDMTSGTPEHVAILPGNSWLPIATAAMLGGFFLMMLAGLYALAPVFLVGTVWLGWRWAWTNGTRGDVGMVPIGGGQSLPTSFEAPRTTGWWGSVFALAASATLFASLLFGYAFLWTIAPNWPPPALIPPSLVVPLLAIAGAAAAGIAVRAGRMPIVLGGHLAIVAALILLLTTTPGPSTHAYAATSAALAAYGLFHAGLAAIMTGFVMARAKAGFHSAARATEPRILRLWSDHGAGAGAFIALLLVLPGWFA